VVDGSDALGTGNDARVVAELESRLDVLVLQGLPVPPLELDELSLDDRAHEELIAAIASFARSAICSGETSSTWVAIDHE